MLFWVVLELVRFTGEVCSAATEVVIVAEISRFCHKSGIAVSLSCGVHAVVEMPGGANVAKSDHYHIAMVNTVVDEEPCRCERKTRTQPDYAGTTGDKWKGEGG